MTRAIAFICNQPSLAGIRFDDFSSNPGIGGSEYVMAQTAYMLACNFSDVRVYFFSREDCSFQNVPTNFQVHRSTEFSSHRSKISTVVINAIDVKSHICDFVVDHSMDQRVLVWSHHPFDFGAKFSAEELRKKGGPNLSVEFLSIGAFQYLSNKAIFGDHYRIESVISLKKLSSREAKFNGKFLFLGGLVEAKGFHLILDAWPSIVKAFPQAELNVIGGEIYGRAERSSFECSYKNRLASLIASWPDQARRSVIFHGILGGNSKQQVMERCCIAILNPTGKSEAFPASVIECWGLGIPVIAGGDFGMKDFMRHFPDLDLLVGNTPLVKRVELLANDKQLYTIVSDRCHKLYLEKYDAHDAILRSWYLLIEHRLNYFVTNESVIKIYLRAGYFFVRFVIKLFWKRMRG